MKNPRPHQTEQSIHEELCHWLQKLFLPDNGSGPYIETELTKKLANILWKNKVAYTDINHFIPLDNQPISIRLSRENIGSLCNALSSAIEDCHAFVTGLQYELSMAWLPTSTGSSYEINAAKNLFEDNRYLFSGDVKAWLLCGCILMPTRHEGNVVATTTQLHNGLQMLDLIRDWIGAFGTLPQYHTFENSCVEIIHNHNMNILNRFDGDAPSMPSIIGDYYHLKKIQCTLEVLSLGIEFNSKASDIVDDDRSSPNKDKGTKGGRGRKKMECNTDDFLRKKLGKIITYHTRDKKKPTKEDWARAIKREMTNEYRGMPVPAKDTIEDALSRWKIDGAPRFFETAWEARWVPITRPVQINSR